MLGPPPGPTDRLRVRRVVTGVDRAGRSTVAEDKVLASDAQGVCSVVAFDPPPVVRIDALADDASWYPRFGGSRVVLFTVPPNVATTQPQPPGTTEYDAILESDGFHSTDSVDTIVVISGEVWVELDTTEVRLGPGDVLVQTGTRHAWRNRGDGWPLVAAFIVGATRLS